jgi:hypothetical protein
MPNRSRASPSGPSRLLPLHTRRTPSTMALSSLSDFSRSRWPCISTGVGCMFPYLLHLAGVPYFLLSMHMYSVYAYCHRSIVALPSSILPFAVTLIHLTPLSDHTFYRDHLPGTGSAAVRFLWLPHVMRIVPPQLSLQHSVITQTYSVLPFAVTLVPLAALSDHVFCPGRHPDTGPAAISFSLASSLYGNRGLFSSRFSHIIFSQSLQTSHPSHPRNMATDSATTTQRAEIGPIGFVP